MDAPRSEFLEASTGSCDAVGDLQRVNFAVKLELTDARAVRDQYAGDRDLPCGAARLDAERAGCPPVLDSSSGVSSFKTFNDTWIVTARLAF